MAAIDGVLADDKSAFVRRVALTAICKMGQSARDAAPEVVDRRIIRGMVDESAWVRHDAAWAAGVISGNNAGYADALKRMIEAAAKDPEAKTPSSAAGKALERAIKSLEIVAERAG